MKNKRKQQRDAIQLDLFVVEDVPQQVATPAPLPAPKQQEMSADEMMNWRLRYIAIGKRYGYPPFEYGDPHYLPYASDPTGQAKGLEAWNMTLLHAPIRWIVAATKWLEAGEYQDSHLLKLIHQRRIDMMLDYAWKRGYSELHGQIDGQSYSIAPGKEAWQKAARNVDRDVLEDAITKLALVEGDAHGQA